MTRSEETSQSLNGWLDEIREREAKATKGPWRWGEWSLYSPSENVLTASYEADKPALFYETSVELIRSEENAEFVKNSRQDIPNLLAYIDVLEAALSRISKDTLCSEGFCYGCQVGHCDGKNFTQAAYIAKTALAWKPEENNA